MVVWEDSLTLLSMYYTALKYKTLVIGGLGTLVDISLNPAVIVELARAKDIAIDDALELIPEVHSGFLSKLLHNNSKGKEDG